MRGPWTIAACAAAGAACALAPLFFRRRRARRLSIDMRDPYEPDARALADAIRAIAARLDACPAPLEIVFYAPDEPGREFVIDLDGDRNFTVSDPLRGETAHVDIRRRWICEHPVPLVIKPGRKTRLYAVPVDANRFRVSHVPPREKPSALPILAGAAAAGAGLAADCAELAAAGGCLALLRSVLCAR